MRQSKTAAAVWTLRLAQAAPLLVTRLVQVNDGDLSTSWIACEIGVDQPQLVFDPQTTKARKAGQRVDRASLRHAPVKAFAHRKVSYRSPGHQVQGFNPGHQDLSLGRLGRHGHSDIWSRQREIWSSNGYDWSLQGDQIGHLDAFRPEFPGGRLTLRIRRLQSNDWKRRLRQERSRFRKQWTALRQILNDLIVRCHIAFHLLSFRDSPRVESSLGARRRN